MANSFTEARLVNVNGSSPRRRARVCVIGAGASGIATARALQKRGISYVVLEKRNDVGGIWYLDGKSPAYEQLHINVSRERLEFGDWPMPKSYPLFPRHSHIARYYRDYVSHFGLDRSIRLGSDVLRASPVPGNAWEIELASGEREVYDTLIVANGHHSTPYLPPAPVGAFAGEQMHSHQYLNRNVLRGRNVVVVGLGNSACDIAVEASYVATSTRLSVRRGAYVLPLALFGRAYDQVPGTDYLLGKGVGVGRFSFRIPWPLAQAAFTAGHRTWFPMEFYGLPRPQHLFGAAHPTQAPHLLERLLHGRIDVRPPIERFDGDLVHFVDGTVAAADLIVWCTGYEISHPFLPPELVPVMNNRVELYRHVFRPGVPNLAFVGLVQASGGSLMQIAEAQANWVGAYLTGEYVLPSESRMWRDIERNERVTARRHVASHRHTIEVSQFEYRHKLDRECRRGRRRARGNRPTVGR